MADRIKVRLTFEEEALGTCSKDPKIHEEFIASKGPNAHTLAEEIEAIGVDEVVERSMTGFSMKDGKPILWDYQIKGFFKDACGMLSRAEDTESGKLRAYRKIIDGLVFVYPRAISLVIPPPSELGECQRPLRASTAQGERIALANSETVSVGTYLDIEIESEKLKAKKGGPDLQKCIIEWLDYGKRRGLGQWRNSGKGRFSYEILD